MSVNLSDAPHGTIHQGLARFGDRVTADHWQTNVIDDPIARKTVEAALRGEIEAASIAPADWAAREMAVSAELAKYGLPAFDAYQVEYMSNGAGVHDRFIPGDLTLQVLFPFFYSWNDTEGNEPIKLGHEVNKEWWRTDRSVKPLSTKTGVLSCDFGRVMQPINLAGWPYNLKLHEDDSRVMDHQKLMKQMGGSGLTTAEQLTYLFIRSVVERRLPLWAAGSARCCNIYGSDYSLSVYWHAADGFCVCFWNRTDQYCYLGAVPEVFTALEG